MKTARFIRQLSDWKSDARLYELSEPMPGISLSDDSAPLTSHVVVSAVVAMITGPETYIFACDADGKTVNMLELDGSFRGALDHAKALNDAGYEVSP